MPTIFFLNVSGCFLQDINTQHITKCQHSRQKWKWNYYILQIIVITVDNHANHVNSIDQQQHRSGNDLHEDSLLKQNPKHLHLTSGHLNNVTIFIIFSIHEVP